ncbi:MAG: 3-methyl-2-oxobutanoate hydroxymethyltransferase [Candidatus Heimdallarchaeota archaeon]|nr:3-methyl-2-oxobutanoate hydroxymethyltransferase [Candidatus Heimdallarchaeota archaeon]MCK5049657.1 3-methyl-2-oxobutanoate hydroxymethyltransferase [Candidatus Heimdallarchaeota archaeon]
MSSKITAPYLTEMKKNNEKISMLTAYDFATASLLDQAGIEVILVGDSLGMVFQGLEDTLRVTLDEVIYHCRAVSRGVSQALVVGDLPFMSYQVSVEQAVTNAGRMIQEGRAKAVKLEGGRERVPEIKKIIEAGIPVMGHIGLTPQSINQLGGWKVQGKNKQAIKTLLQDAQELEKAGVFSMVLEGLPPNVAKKITEKVTIPTIGIGAGVHCDGQVLVINDMLGLTDFQAKFVKNYANLKDEITTATKKFVSDVKESLFPGKETSYEEYDFS